MARGAPSRDCDACHIRPALGFRRHHGRTRTRCCAMRAGAAPLAGGPDYVTSPRHTVILGLCLEAPVAICSCACRGTSRLRSPTPAVVRRSWARFCSSAISTADQCSSGGIPPSCSANIRLAGRKTFDRLPTIGCLRTTCTLSSRHGPDPVPRAVRHSRATPRVHEATRTYGPTGTGTVRRS